MPLNKETKPNLKRRKKGRERKKELQWGLDRYRLIEREREKEGERESERDKKKDGYICIYIERERVRERVRERRETDTEREILQISFNDLRSFDISWETKFP